MNPEWSSKLSESHRTVLHPYPKRLSCRAQPGGEFISKHRSPMTESHPSFLSSYIPCTNSFGIGVQYRDVRKHLAR